MKKQNKKIIKTFLNNGKYKSKHFKIKNKCLYFQNIKIAYKGNHAKGDNVKIDTIVFTIKSYKNQIKKNAQINGHLIDQLLLTI